MTPQQIALVQGSFEQVAPIAATAAQLFYGRLFAIAPEVEPLFKTTDMDEQGRKLMGTLAVVVGGLSDLEALLPAVRGLAARHVAYGVAAGHYAPVGEALIWTLERGLGEAFTPETREAWGAAYARLSNVMIDEAYGQSSAAE